MKTIKNSLYVMFLSCIWCATVLYFYVILLSVAEAQTVTLKASWDAVTANPQVTSYNVYRDNIKIGTTPNTELNVSVDTTKQQTFEVSAVNLIGESDKSLPLLVARPAKPTNLKLQN